MPGLFSGNNFKSLGKQTLLSYHSTGIPVGSLNWMMGNPKQPHESPVGQGFLRIHLTLLIRKMNDSLCSYNTNNLKYFPNVQSSFYCIRQKSYQVNIKTNLKVLMLEVYKYEFRLPLWSVNMLLIERDNVFWECRLHFYVCFTLYTKYHFYPLQLYYVLLQEVVSLSD